MQLAVLSDIHGNLPALQVVLADIARWRPDVVVVNGDVVNRGPQPAECWRLIAAELADSDWLITRGNHEEYVAAWLQQRDDLTEAERDLFKSSRWSFQQLARPAVEQMVDLPLAVTVTADGGDAARITHASLRGTTDGVGPWTSDAELALKIEPAPALFVTAHTHRAFTRRLNGTLVVNSGAVGCPLDGDTRASYARLTWQNEWHVELVRLEYDRAETERQFAAVGFVQQTGATGRIMYQEWLEAQPHFPSWHKVFGAAIKDGSLTPQQTVDAYFESL